MSLCDLNHHHHHHHHHQHLKVSSGRALLMSRSDAPCATASVPCSDHASRCGCALTLICARECVRERARLKDTVHVVIK